MESKLQVLGLLLQELNEPLEIDSLDARLRLQKAVYLAQLFGVDLGYRYSWYVKGPYSPSLTQDYYRLKELEASALEGRSLREDLKNKLSQAASFLKKPPEAAPMSVPQWYELLASLHYLYKISGLSREKVVETIARLKPHLANWVWLGEKHLQAIPNFK